MDQTSGTRRSAFERGLAFTLGNQALSDARRALAASIEQQAAAQVALEKAARELVHRREQATLSASDDAVDAFAAWLPKGRLALHQAVGRVQREAMGAACARAVLNLARAAIGGEGAG